MFALSPLLALKLPTITLKLQIELRRLGFGLPTGTPAQIRTRTSKSTATTSIMEMLKLQFSTTITTLFKIGPLLQQGRTVGILVGLGGFSLRLMIVRRMMIRGQRMAMQLHGM